MQRIPLFPSPYYSTSGDLEFFPAIVGGTPVTDGEFPAQVSIQTRAGSKHICGGTIIDYDFVLTSAHCLTNSLGETSKASEVSP